MAWKEVKRIPKKIVNKSGMKESFLLNKLWWAHVTVTPLIKRILVLRRGTWKGSIEKILKGGQREPKSFLGFKLLWKKAQNQAEKNKTSLKIKRSIPHFNPSRTSKLWNPVSLSRLTSRHHLKILTKAIKNRNKKRKVLDVLKKISKFKIILKIKIDIKRGQGDRETIWNLWKLIWKIFRPKLKIIQK